ncbi:D-ribose pyranase [Mediterraneibacter sp. NSJ-55]|uniref:D-ribose pyranase n=1 Tax=Mediterraneibacter hominis TaxID=2763054 RepID=A0A923RRB4_9FIRM|nr:D-ribose pyranase [Mediterraneibacter hominis]MBC5689523.1 D-ribose pyranase [Mediterraneibacter hominis]
MKKTGILNAELVGELAKIRHQDKLVICDIGFPIPKGATVVDVSLAEGIPTFMQVLKAVLNEIIVEDYTIFDFMKQYNTEYYNQIQKFFVNQTHAEVSMPEFVELSREAKLFIRTGEGRPASNILLTSATGVKEMNCKLDIKFDTIL